MDGVVVDSERHWVPLENERILPEAVESGSPSAHEVTGMNVGDIYDYLDGEYGTTVDESAFRALYGDAARELYTERAALMDGFEDLVADLGDRGVAVALVSSSPHEWIDYVLDRFALREGFDEVVSGDAIDGPSKPDPAVYEVAADRLGVDPTRCVAVEDSSHGVAAATAAGMTCVGYATPDNDQDLSAADLLASDPADLRDRLLSNWA